ncbi:hypothetical protein AArc1_5105 (plasmid) [Natrarchaeobaculum sulfurireducens]|uniref:DUF8106 domain-containing protein n=1 Tax=Natrarchaeobaculum sulfurireducens TaxID=2044521 RepID=A0A346P9W1_9EURY|nr:hypothetical protein AArc1_5105 [Natrarchaeobaculum sulfurireducens]
MAHTYPSTNTSSKTKLSLICQTCGYEEQIYGEWIEEKSKEYRSLICPECHTTVDQRHAYPTNQQKFPD